MHDNIVMAAFIRKHKKPLRASTGKRSYSSLPPLYFYFSVLYFYCANNKEISVLRLIHTVAYIDALTRIDVQQQ